ncbi:MAG: DUF1566 domain-containing protein [Candidatus Puniceispirillaceae bacterium]
MQRRTFSLTGFSKSIIPQIVGLIGLCGVLIICFSASVRAEEQVRSANFILSGFAAIDLRSGVKWMRCSVGQVFEDGNCVGKIVRLNHDEIKQAITQANTQLGGIWRLPTREELEFLVCNSCKDVKIDQKVFPDTVAEPYWTGQKNWISPKNIWTVNFMTGHTYGRFFEYQRLAVRLVQDR